MILYIVRGLPGSGKSTYAKSLGCFHLESDMFHQRGGKYTFNIGKRGIAHDWLKYMTKCAMAQGIDLVVSNTFTRMWEVKPYIALANLFGYEVRLVTLKTSFGNIHNVPEGVLKDMAMRWEDFELEDVK